MRPSSVLLTASAAAASLLTVLTCAAPQDATGPGAPAFSTAEPPAPVLLAAGDIASCDTDKGDVMTAALINSMPEALVATLGDNAYPNGSAADYATCYNPTWGQFKDRTRPSLGNHEYDTGEATASFDYFGDAAWGGSRPHGYYSFDVGEWHIIVLNDNNQFVSIGSSSPQVQWLKADLAANTKSCTLAIWHQPLFSSSYDGQTPGYLTQRKNLWVPLYAAKADVVLNGHKHVYERFGLQDPVGNATPDGIRQFIAGTGGDNTGAQPTVLSPNSEVQHGGRNHFGVLKLTLKPGSYDWEYLPVGGNTFTDRGSTPCHKAAAPSGATIALNGGSGQSTTVGTPVAVPPSVRATDANGAPLQGVPVTFSVSTGGGTITGAAQTTDACGIATVGSWTLGQTAGSNSLRATASGLAGSPVTITATGTPGDASAAASTATVPAGVAGSGTTILVRAKDQFGNALTTGGETIAVDVSGANATAAPVTDNGNGTYTATYTPRAVGIDTVRVTLSGTPLGGSPYVSPVAPKLAKCCNSSSTQSAPAGTAVPFPPAVRVTDGNGVALGGVTVTFTVLQGDGTVVPTSVVSNASGIATVESWTLGATPGTNKLRAGVSALSFVYFWGVGN